MPHRFVPEVSSREKRRGPSVKKTHHLLGATSSNETVPKSAAVEAAELEAVSNETATDDSVQLAKSTSAVNDSVVDSALVVASNREAVAAQDIAVG